MIDSKLRAELSIDVRRLATGRMTNDDFDDKYYLLYDNSDDQAIKSIAGLCYSLYSSDLLFPIRLRGKYALDKETKKVIARCVLFLRSGNEYSWPDFPAYRNGGGLMQGAVSIALLLCVLIMLTEGPLFIFNPTTTTLQILGIGLTLMAIYILCLFFTKTSEPSEAWTNCAKSGDIECWPFNRRETYDTACRENHMLGKSIS